jgi:chorismate dehydratase
MKEMMERKKVSIVSYLNSKPFLWGLEASPVKEFIDISVDIPSKVAAKLASGKADIGLIPVAALRDLGNYWLVSDFCIGTTRNVRTVVLASEVPLEEIDTILLDYQSRTSVMLVQVLSRFFWKKEFRWENTCANFEKKLIKGKTAGVVIGDRVFSVENKIKHIYDLGSEWFKFSGLPFVFAAWASNSELSDNFCRQFSSALETGIKMIPWKIEEIKNEFNSVDLTAYFSENISFDFDESKRKGLELFLNLIEQLNSGKH